MPFRPQEKLASDQKKFTADAQRLGREISEDEADIANGKADLDAMRKARDMEHSQFLASQTDYSE